MLKHNKKRNIAFVFEGLMREMAHAVINKDSERKKLVLHIVKAHFKKGTVLKEALSLYNSVIGLDEKMTRHVAEKVLIEARLAYSKLDEKKLFLEQSALINNVNRKLGKDFFGNFVPNYKNLATVYQLFNASMNLREKVLLEEKYLNAFVFKHRSEQKNYEIDKFVFKEFLSKFNGTYGELLEEQRGLLNRYVLSLFGDKAEFNLYLNEELGRLRGLLTKALLVKEVARDSDMLLKTRTVLKSIDQYKNKPFDKDLMLELLKIQQLVHEINN